MRGRQITRSNALEAQLQPRLDLATVGLQLIPSYITSNIFQNSPGFLGQMAAAVHVLIWGEQWLVESHIVPTLAKSSGALTHIPSRLPKSPRARGLGQQGLSGMPIVSDNGWGGGPAHCGARKKTHTLAPVSLEGLGSSESAWQAARAGRGMTDSLLIGKLPSLA